MGLLDIMNQCENAIKAYNQALSATSANIANMSVTGYKRIEVSFQSVFEKVLSQGSAASTFNNFGGTNPRQLGQGMDVAQVGIDMTAGDLSAGKSYQLAIRGNGFFIVSPDGGSTLLYTRAGDFKINAGNLQTTGGMQVYGLNSSNQVVPITGLTGTADNYAWNSASGELQYSGGSLNPPVRIALSYFDNPGGLVQSTGSTYRASLASGTAHSAVAAGGAAGNIVGGNVEASNVFYLSESIDALEFQRAMSGNLTMVKMASDIISNFISKIG